MKYLLAICVLLAGCKSSDSGGDDPVVKDTSRKVYGTWAYESPDESWETNVTHKITATSLTRTRGCDDGRTIETESAIEVSDAKIEITETSSGGSGNCVVLLGKSTLEYSFDGEVLVMEDPFGYDETRFTRVE